MGLSYSFNKKVDVDCGDVTALSFDIRTMSKLHTHGSCTVAVPYSCV